MITHGKNKRGSYKIVMYGETFVSDNKPNIDELSRRLNELLNVLNMISRDLIEISKALREINPPTSTSPFPQNVRKIEEIKSTFSQDLEGMLNFEETETYVIIKPRQYLGSDNFAKIAAIIRGMGGEYVSAGRESHFRVSKS